MCKEIKKTVFDYRLRKTLEIITERSVDSSLSIHTSTNQARVKVKLLSAQVVQLSVKKKLAKMTNLFQLFDQTML